MGASKKGQRTKNVVRRNSLKAKAKGKGKKGSRRSNKKKGKRRTYKKKGGAGSEFVLTPKQKEELEKLGFSEIDIINLQDYLNNVGLSIKSETGKEIIEQVKSSFDVDLRVEQINQAIIEYNQAYKDALKAAEPAVPAAPSAPSAAPSAPQADPNNNPPSYEEAMAGRP